jgi:glycosyltransferase involved in cell wall biosynthesis
MMSSVVSIVLTTRNGAKTLAGTLTSIGAQTYRNLELIIIDGGSSDRSRELLSRYGEVHECSPGLSQQINAGLRLATGTFILLLEQDQSMEPDVILECVKLADEGNYDAIVVPETRGGSYWMRSRTIEADLYLSAGDYSARFFRRNLLKLVGFFDTDLSGFRDYDFAFKMHSATSAYGVVNASILSKSDDDLAAYARKFYSRGFAAVTVARRHGSNTLFAPYLYLLKHPTFLFRKRYSRYLVGFSLVKIVEIYSILLSIAVHRRPQG